MDHFVGYHEIRTPKEERIVCEAFTSSQGPAADSSPTLFSDMSQFARSSGTPTVAKSSENAPPKDGFPDCKCGRETFGCSLHPSGKEEWIASMRDSLVRIFQLLETRQVLAKERDRGFTVKSCAALMKYDQATSSWKTYQRSLETEWEQFSEIWPRAGILADGVVYVHPMSELATEGNDGGVWPTPTTRGLLGGSGSREMVQWMVERGELDQFEAIGILGVKLWPTPRAQSARGTGPSRVGNKADLQTVVGGKLNPTWVEWLMAWPLGWTVSRLWVMGKFRFKRQPRSKS